MRANSFLRAGMAVFAFAAMLAGAMQAQRNGAKTAALHSFAYDLSKEQSVQGTVVKLIERSDTAPIGAHVLVQTVSGQIDVHLGDARILKQNNFSVAAGDSVRFVGVTSTNNGSSVFLARLVQIGSNVLAVRSTTGIPYTPSGIRGKQDAQAAKQQAGAR
jgi:hypothetical protein